MLKMDYIAYSEDMCAVDIIVLDPTRRQDLTTMNYGAETMELE